MLALRRDVRDGLAAFGIRLLIIPVARLSSRGCTQKSGFVVQDAIFVVVEPHCIGIAAHDADFSAVGHCASVQQLHDDHTISLPGKPGMGSLVTAATSVLPL